MNRRQLRIFAAVAQYLNFSRAADKIHIAQPSVRIAIWTHSN